MATNSIQLMTRNLSELSFKSDALNKCAAAIQGLSDMVEMTVDNAKIAVAQYITAPEVVEGLKADGFKTPAEFAEKGLGMARSTAMCYQQVGNYIRDGKAMNDADGVLFTFTQLRNIAGIKNSAELIADGTLNASLTEDGIQNLKKELRAIAAAEKAEKDAAEGKAPAEEKPRPMREYLYTAIGADAPEKELLPELDYERDAFRTFRENGATYFLMLDLVAGTCYTVIRTPVEKSKEESTK